MTDDGNNSSESSKEWQQNHSETNLSNRQVKTRGKTKNGRAEYVLNLQLPALTYFSYTELVLYSLTEFGVYLKLLAETNIFG